MVPKLRPGQWRCPNGRCPAEDESWDDLKDVVSTDPLYQNEGGVSITSRLRSSVLSQDMNIIEQPQDQGQEEVVESPLVPFDNVLVPTDVTPTAEITIPDDHDAKDEVSLL